MAKKRIAARRVFDFLLAFLIVSLFAAGSAAHTQTNDQAWLSYSGGSERLAIPAPIPPSIRALGSSVLEQSAV